MTGEPTRRTFLATLGTGVAAVALAGCSGTDDRATPPATTGPGATGPDGDGAPAGSLPPTAPGIAALAVAHFADLGYEVLEPLPLVTDNPFNGGVRYDASTGTPPDRGVRVQPCARVEDAGGDAPTLALFHQVDARNTVDGVSNEDGLAAAVDLLVGTVGLDPSRLGAVSTDLIAPYVPVLADLGVPAAQVVQRPVAEAVAAGDGSGYFDPPGHTGDVDLYTVSLHYRLTPDGTDPLTHPAGPGWIELGELSLNVGPQADSPQMVWGFGLERLELARDGAAGRTYEESRLALLAALEEAEAAGAGRPPAYEVFAG